MSQKLQCPTPAAKRARSSEEGSTPKFIDEESLVSLILQTSGVTDYAPGVPAHLLELMHGYSEELLADAHDYCHHAGRKTTEVADVKLALETRSLVSPVPSREARVRAAQQVNVKKLPNVPGRAGLRIPPTDATLLGHPFRLAPSEEVWKRSL